jgi:hypothetical protein
MNEQPLVSVVIPTRERPELVIRAVRSALSQTYQNLEIIVVIDGPDPSTIEALKQVADVRLRWVEQPLSSGACAARNRGVDEAAGPWVALLDDDDEWLPTKIEKQMAVAEASLSAHPIITSRLYARREKVDEIWPFRPLAAGESMSEYLFCRSGIGQGEGYIQTSTILTSRNLLSCVPFTKGLSRHQDWDWLIRVTSHPGVGVAFVWEPLVVWHLGESRSSISRSTDPTPSMAWVEMNEFITPKAKAYFLATQIAPRWKAKGLGYAARILRATTPYPHAAVLSLIFMLTSSPQRRILLGLTRKIASVCH